MARRRRSTQRDTPDITRPLLRPTILSELEDRRQFHPLHDVRPARGFTKNDSLLYVRPVGDRVSGRKDKKWRPETFQFAVPKRVAICIRRKQRREVLFALKRSGKGSKARRRRRNYYSDVSCK